MKKILLIFGTRPEAIKMAPVVKALARDAESFQPVVCVTAQHREMLDQMLALFEIKPDLDLNMMEEDQTLDSLTANAIRAVTNALRAVQPDVVMVQGDTTTAMVAALASFYQKIPVGHVEAGLRTKDIYNPFPEEANRHIISVLATYHFAPTSRAVATLLGEGITREKIFLTGNTVVDALHWILERGGPPDFDRPALNGHKLILVTAHRRENFGRPLENICMALKEIVRRNRDVEIIYPVHLNPHVSGPVYKMLSYEERVHLVPPMEYHQMVSLLKGSYLVLTDSGGIQEEAPALGKPVLVMRNETERPEGVDAHVAKVIGTETESILKETEFLLRDHAEYLKMAMTVSPYGDGHAAERIAEALRGNKMELPNFIPAPLGAAC